MSTYIMVQDPTFRGRHRDFTSYRNQDSIHYTQTCCGQAAVHSAYHTVRGHAWATGFSDFVHSTPPDNVFGILGTSPGRISTMLFNLQFSGRDGHGRSSLRRTLRQRPAIVCVDVNKIDSSRIGLHWVCVFGYGDDYMYVSNWPDWRISRAAFKEAWSAPLVTVCGAGKRFFKV